MFTERDFGWRDYFRGACKLAPSVGTGRASVYVSRAYQARLDDLYEFAIAVPIYAEWGSPVMHGVVVASITTDSTLGTLLPMAGPQEALWT